jgi:hypothetical protein
MNVTPNEAEEALDSIQSMMEKTRHAIATSGAYITLLITGIVWLIGFLATQFLPTQITIYVWIGVSILATVLGVLLGIRVGPRVRSPSANATAKRAGLFWLLLICFGIATIFVARPTDGKQVTMFIILFTMLGQLAMGPLVSFSSVWWAIPITILALAGYFLLPGFFYVWIAVVGGGGMIALALYIRSRW